MSEIHVKERHFTTLETHCRWLLRCYELGKSLPGSFSVVPEMTGRLSSMSKIRMKERKFSETSWDYCLGAESSEKNSLSAPQRYQSWLAGYETSQKFEGINVILLSDKK